MLIKLIPPTAEYKEKIMGYKADFIANGDSMDGSAGLMQAESFEAWFGAVQENSTEETVREGLVPSTTLMAVNDSDEIVGMIDIRHRLNGYLLHRGGNIGYSVVKAHRQKGIATKMLGLALDKCRALALDKILVTCKRGNIGSAKAITNNGGTMENEVCDGDDIIQRYWISL